MWSACIHVGEHVHVWVSEAVGAGEQVQGWSTLRNSENLKTTSLPQRCPADSKYPPGVPAGTSSPPPPQLGFHPGSPSKEEGRVRLEALSRAGPEGRGLRPVAREWSLGDAGHPYLLLR